MKCWPATSSISPDGYGRVRYDGRTQLIHRVAYEILVGPIPDGLELDHLCRNRACYNPAHLEPVTRQENILRGAGPDVQRARFAALTHCKNGHLWAENTYRRKDGRRNCRSCVKERLRRWRST